MEMNGWMGWMQWVNKVFDYSSEYFDFNHMNNGHDQLLGMPKVYPKYGGKFFPPFLLRFVLF
jgi:hypothetical protein